MPVIDIDKDLDNCTMTVTAEFDATVARVWQVWSDPRQLERWWGPPTYPATFVDHDFATGGRVTYYMTSPEGEKYHGWWVITSIDAPHCLEFEDGFADDNGEPNAAMPTTLGHVTLTERAGGGTQMVIQSTFASRESMEQLLAMGMDEGLRAALGQIDAIVAS